jgi:hypothetical protein
MSGWFWRLVDALDLEVNDESEMRGFIKGMAAMFAIVVVVTILTTIAYQKANGG